MNHFFVLPLLVLCLLIPATTGNAQEGNKDSANQEGNRFSQLLNRCSLY